MRKNKIDTKNALCPVDYRWHHGTVAMLDKLGTKGMSRQETEKFMTTISDLQSKSQTYASDSFKEFNIKYDASIPEIILFNDTVFIRSDQGNMRPLRMHIENKHFSFRVV
jgi:hypothetical protein